MPVSDGSISARQLAKEIAADLAARLANAGVPSRLVSGPKEQQDAALVLRLDTSRLHESGVAVAYNALDWAQDRRLAVCLAEAVAAATGLSNMGSRASFGGVRQPGVPLITVLIGPPKAKLEKGFSRAVAEGVQRGLSRYWADPVLEEGEQRPYLTVKVPPVADKVAPTPAEPRFLPECAARLLSVPDVAQEAPEPGEAASEQGEAAAEQREAPVQVEAASDRVLIVEPQIVIPSLAQPALPDEARLRAVRRSSRSLPRRSRPAVHPPKPEPKPKPQASEPVTSQPAASEPQASQSQPPEPYLAGAPITSPPPKSVPNASAPLSIMAPSFQMVRTLGNPWQRRQASALEPPGLSDASAVHIFTRPQGEAPTPVHPPVAPTARSLPRLLSQPRSRPPTARVIQPDSAVIRFS